MNNTNQFGLPDEPPEGTELIDNEKFSRKAVTARISPEDIENVLNKLDFFDKTITPTKTFKSEEEKQNYITSITLEDIAKRINPDLIEGRRYAEPVTEEERKLAKAAGTSAISNINVLKDLAWAKQSNAKEYLYAATKGIGIALATMVDNAVGTAAGLVNSIGSDEPLLDFINNPVSAVIQDFEAELENVLPTYYPSDWEQRNTGQKVFTSNFWADNVLKNLGFALGTYLSGAGAGALISKGLKAGTRRIIGRKLGENFGEKLAKGELDDLARIITTDASKTNLALSGLEIDKIIKTASTLERTNRLITGVSSTLLGIQGEARVEALNARDQIMDKLSNAVDEKGNKLFGDDEVVKYVNSLMNSIFITNLAILAPTEFLQFGSHFLGSYKISNSIKHSIEGDILKGFALKKTPKFLKPINPAVKLVQNGTFEGSQEYLQFIAENTGYSVADDIIDNPDAFKNVSNLYSSFIESIPEGIDRATNSEGSINFLSGFLLGTLGIPTFQKGNFISGGIYEVLKTDKNNRKQAKEIVDYLNKNIDVLRSYANFNIAGSALQLAKEAALKDNDVFKHENAESELIFQLLSTLNSVGRLDDFVSQSKAFTNIDLSKPEGQNLINEIKELSIIKDESGNVTSNAFESFSDQEIADIVVKRNKKLIEKAKYVKELSNRVKDLMPGQDIHTQSKFIHDNYMLKEIDTRLKDMKLEIDTKLKAINADINISVSDKDIIDREKFLRPILETIYSKDKIKLDPEIFKNLHSIITDLKSKSIDTDFQNTVSTLEQTVTNLENNLKQFLNDYESIDIKEEPGNEFKKSKIITEFLNKSTETIKEINSELMTISDILNSDRLEEEKFIAEKKKLDEELHKSILKTTNKDNIHLYALMEQVNKSYVDKVFKFIKESGDLRLLPDLEKVRDLANDYSKLSRRRISIARDVTMILKELDSKKGSTIKNIIDKAYTHTNKVLFKSKMNRLSAQPYLYRKEEGTDNKYRLVELINLTENEDGSYTINYRNIKIDEKTDLSLKTDIIKQENFNDWFSEIELLDINLLEGKGPKIVENQIKPGTKVEEKPTTKAEEKPTEEKPSENIPTTKAEEETTTKAEEKPSEKTMSEENNVSNIYKDTIDAFKFVKGESPSTSGVFTAEKPDKAFVIFENPEDQHVHIGAVGRLLKVTPKERNPYYILGLDDGRAFYVINSQQEDRTKWILSPNNILKLSNFEGTWEDETSYTMIPFNGNMYKTSNSKGIIYIDNLALVEKLKEAQAEENIEDIPEDIDFIDEENMRSNIDMFNKEVKLSDQEELEIPKEIEGTEEKQEQEHTEENVVIFNTTEIQDLDEEKAESLNIAPASIVYYNKGKHKKVIENFDLDINEQKDNFDKLIKILGKLTKLDENSLIGLIAKHTLYVNNKIAFVFNTTDKLNIDFDKIKLFNKIISFKEYDKLSEAEKTFLNGFSTTIPGTNYKAIVFSSPALKESKGYRLIRKATKLESIYGGNYVVIDVDKNDPKLKIRKNVAEYEGYKWKIKQLKYSYNPAIKFMGYELRLNKISPNVIVKAKLVKDVDYIEKYNEDGVPEYYMPTQEIIPFNKTQYRHTFVVNPAANLKIISSMDTYYVALYKMGNFKTFIKIPKKVYIREIKTNGDLSNRAFQLNHNDRSNYLILTDLEGNGVPFSKVYDNIETNLDEESDSDDMKIRSDLIHHDPKELPSEAVYFSHTPKVENSFSKTISPIIISREELEEDEDLNLVQKDFITQEKYDKALKTFNILNLLDENAESSVLDAQVENMFTINNVSANILLNQLKASKYKLRILKAKDFYPKPVLEYLDRKLKASGSEITIDDALIGVLYNPAKKSYAYLKEDNTVGFTQNLENFSNEDANGGIFTHFSLATAEHYTTSGILRYKLPDPRYINPSKFESMFKEVFDFVASKEDLSKLLTVYNNLYEDVLKLKTKLSQEFENSKIELMKKHSNKKDKEFISGLEKNIKEEDPDLEANKIYQNILNKTRKRFYREKYNDYFSNSSLYKEYEKLFTETVGEVYRSSYKKTFINPIKSKLDKLPLSSPLMISIKNKSIGKANKSIDLVRLNEFTDITSSIKIASKHSYIVEGMPYITYNETDVPIVMDRLDSSDAQIVIKLLEALLNNSVVYSNGKLALRKDLVLEDGSSVDLIQAIKNIVGFSVANIKRDKGSEFENMLVNLESRIGLIQRVLSTSNLDKKDELSLNNELNNLFDRLESLYKDPNNLLNKNPKYHFFLRLLSKDGIPKIHLFGKIYNFYIIKDNNIILNPELVEALSRDLVGNDVTPGFYHNVNKSVLDKKTKIAKLENDKLTFIDVNYNDYISSRAKITNLNYKGFPLFLNQYISYDTDIEEKETLDELPTGYGFLEAFTGNNETSINEVIYLALQEFYKIALNSGKYPNISKAEILIRYFINKPLDDVMSKAFDILDQNLKSGNLDKSVKLIQDLLNTTSAKSADNEVNKIRNLLYSTLNSILESYKNKKTSLNEYVEKYSEFIKEKYPSLTTGLSEEDKKLIEQEEETKVLVKHYNDFLNSSLEHSLWLISFLDRMANSPEIKLDTESSILLSNIMDSLDTVKLSVINSINEAYSPVTGGFLLDSLFENTDIINTLPILLEKLIQDYHEGEEFSLIKSYNSPISNDEKKATIKKRFGNSVKLVIVDSLLNGKASGATIGNVIQLVENASKDVLDHESFEVAFKLLTEDERRDILNEAKNNPILKEKLREFKENGTYDQYKQIYGEDEDRIIKETLAEEFVDYVKSSGTKTYKNNPYKNWFFKFIWEFFNWVKSLLNKSYTIDQLFYDIENGNFKDRVFSDIDSTINYKLEQKYDIYFNPRIINKIFSSLDVLLGNYLSNNDFDINKDLVEKMFKDFRENKIKLPLIIKDEFSANLYKDLEESEELRYEIISQYRNKLVRLKLLEEVETLDSIVDDTEEDQLSNDSLSLYGDDRNLKFNIHKHTSGNVRTLLLGIPKEDINELGLKEAYPVTEVIHKLSNILNGITSYDEALIIMKKNLNDNVIRSVLGRLYSLDSNKITKALDLLSKRTSFVQAFSKVPVNYVSLLLSKEGNAVVNNSLINLENQILIKLRNDYISRELKNKKLILDENNHYIYNNEQFKKKVEPYGYIKEKEVNGVITKEFKINRNASSDVLNVVAEFLGIDPIFVFETTDEVRDRLLFIAKDLAEDKKVIFIFSDDVPSDQNTLVNEYVKFEVKKDKDSLPVILSLEGDRLSPLHYFGYIHHIFNTLKNMKLNPDRIIELANYYGYEGTSEIDALYYLYPQLNPKFNPFRKNSLLLENNDATFDIYNAIGITLIGEQGEQTISNYRDLNLLDREVLWINLWAQGYYKLPRPSDSHQERFVHFGDEFRNLITDKESRKTQTLKYISSEIEYYIKVKRSGNYIHVTDNQLEGLLINIIKTFNSNLYDKIIDFTNTLLNTNDDKYVEKIETFIERSEISDSINLTIEDYLNTSFEAYRSYMIDKVGLISRKNNVMDSIIGVENKLVNKITGNDRDYITFLKNYYISNFYAKIEIFKLLLNNPVEYLDVRNAVKRFNMTASPKRIQDTSESLSKKLVSLHLLDDADDLYLNPETSEVQDTPNHHPIIRTLVVDDIRVIQSNWLELSEVLLDNDPEFQNLLNKYNKDLVNNENIDEDINNLIKYVSDTNAGSYINMTETDGFSLISLDGVIRIMLRDGSPDLGKYLELYFYEMSNLMKWRIENEADSDKKADLIKRYEKTFRSSYKEKFINPFTKEPLTKAPNIELPMLKLQYAGPMADNLQLHTGYKTALGIAWPSFAIDFETGEIKNKNLLNSIITMLDNKTSIISFYSANKSITSKLNKDGEKNIIVQEDGNFNFVNVVNNYQDTYAKYWGVHVITTTNHGFISPFGTQMAKQIISNIYDTGQPINEELAEYTKKYLKLISTRLQLSMDLLRNKLGIKYNHTLRRYVLDNNSKQDLMNLLLQEIDRRGFELNFRNKVIQWFNNNDDVSGIINDTMFQNLLFGILKNDVTSRRVFGLQAFQHPSTFIKDRNTYETHLKTYIKENYNIDVELKFSKSGTPYLVSSDLKFYNKDSPVAQVILPNFYKKVLDIKSIKDKRLLKIIGFRIPTSGLNLIENFEVVDFLPSSYGNIIIVPSAIVAKAGSDFDIDKLYLYFYNIFYNVNNDPVVIDKNITYENYLKEMSKIYFNITDNLFSVEIDNERPFKDWEQIRTILSNEDYDLDVSISQKFSLYINELVDDVTNTFSDYITYTDSEGNIYTKENLDIKEYTKNLFHTYLKNNPNGNITEFKLYIASIKKLIDEKGKILTKELIDLLNNNEDIKPGVSELFESNPTLANAVYEALGLNIINESEITYTDEEGNPCAKMGLTNTVKGTDWKIVKDFKGKPKHSNGGVDITISDKGVTIRRGGKDIKAKYGLLIINNN